MASEQRSSRCPKTETVAGAPIRARQARRRARRAVSICCLPGVHAGASIAPVTLANFLEAADALGYAVNDLARGLLLKGQGSRFISVRPTAQVGHGIGFREIVIHYSASATGSIKRE
jgi:hypothetical protein